MKEIDKSSLIEFFGVLPSSQDKEEEEFFGSTKFEIDRDDVQLSFSVSPSGLSASLKSKPAGDELFSITLPELNEIRIDPLTGGASQLLCRVVGIARTAISEQAEIMTQEVIIRIDPTISIRVRTRLNNSD